MKAVSGLALDVSRQDLTRLPQDFAHRAYFAGCDAVKVLCEHNDGLERMKHRTFALVLLGAALAGCGGSDGDGTPAPALPTNVVFVSAAPTSLAVDAHLTLSAVAVYGANASGNTAVTWMVTCGSPGACGSFEANDEVGAVTYTAPAAIPSGTTVTVTATAVADTAITASAKISIVAPIPIAVNVQPTPTASIQVAATVALTAEVTNDTTANPSVTWSVSCAAANCGTFAPTSTASGTQTQFTAPATIPSGASVTITAASVTDPTKSATVKMSITAAAPSLANGTYVFQIPGPVGNQATFVTGVFVASNGTVAGGEQDSLNFTTDVNGNTVGNPEFQPITGGSYVTLPDGNLQVSLTLQDGGSETFAGTQAKNGQGLVDGINGVSTSATLEPQTSLAAPTAGYALALFGGDAEGAPLWLAGVVDIDGSGSISGAGSSLDVVDGDTELTGTYSLGTGSVSAPDTYGRVIVQLSPTGSGSLQPISLAAYSVDAAHLRLVETGDVSNSSTFAGVFGGIALSQGASTGAFTATALAGTTYVFGAQGQDASGPLQIAGLFELNVDGSVTGSLNWNDLTATAAQSPLPFTGTYSLDPTGRLTLSHLTDNATFNYSLQVYLGTGGTALLVSNDANDSFMGQAFQQQTAPFTAAALATTVGLDATVWSPVEYASGAQSSPALGPLRLQAAGASVSIGGFADLGDGSSFALSGGITLAAGGIGTGMLTGLDPRSRSTTGNATLYYIDDGHAVLLEADPGESALGIWQATQ
jgi:hypothetical protein